MESNDEECILRDAEDDCEELDEDENQLFEWEEGKEDTEEDHWDPIPN